VACYSAALGGGLLTIICLFGLACSSVSRQFTLKCFAQETLAFLWAGLRICVVELEIVCHRTARSRECRFPGTMLVAYSPTENAGLLVTKNVADPE